MRIQKFIDYLLLEKKYSPQTVVAYQKDIEAFQLFLTHEFTDTSLTSLNTAFSNEGAYIHITKNKLPKALQAW